MKLTINPVISAHLKYLKYVLTFDGLHYSWDWDMLHLDFLIWKIILVGKRVLRSRTIKSWDTGLIIVVNRNCSQIRSP